MVIKIGFDTCVKRVYDIHIGAAMKKRVNISLDEDTISQLKRLAEGSHRNVSQWITDKVWETVEAQRERSDTMLAYNENGVLQEYEETSGVVECSYCHKKYAQTIVEQVPGFRDRDYDICPYCGESNGSSMEVEYTNRRLEA